MAGRAKPAPPAPVAALTDAVQARDLPAIVQALADEVQLEIPPLHTEVSGRMQVADAITYVLHVFPDMRYTLRQRYTAPGSVTDEVLFEGSQQVEFLGAPPSGLPGSVAARVMFAHDEQQVTKITLWPDLGALRQLSAGVARTIDLTGSAPSSAPAMVANLRASIPPPHKESKLIIGTARQADPVQDRPGPVPTAAPQRATRPAVAGRGDMPKPPVPRRVRRRRAVAAGGVMLLTSAGLVGWVARGALERPPGTVTFQAVKDVEPTPTPSPTASRVARPPSRPSTTPTAPKKQLSKQDVGAGRIRYTVAAGLLFNTGSWDPLETADAVLERVAQDMIREGRRGTIVVLGYTDDTGDARSNLVLSQQRADAVREILVAKLPRQGIRVTAEGRGVDDTYPNTTEAGRQLNRRVTITVPAVPAVPAAPTVP